LQKWHRLPADRSSSVAARRPPDGLAGQDTLRRPPAAIRGAPPPPQALAPLFPPPRGPEAPGNPTLLPPRPPVDSPPAKLPGHRRPLQRAHGEQVNLPVPSPRPLTPCSTTAARHLPRPPSGFVSGEAPATNSRPRRHQMAQRVAPSISPTSPPPIAAQIGGLELHPSSSVSHGAADVSMTSA
jgi:hypothetical protein